jgi:hypothetical protein
MLVRVCTDRLKKAFQLTMTGFESFITEELRSVGKLVAIFTIGKSGRRNAYLKDMPYCETASYPDFHTSVTSQAFVA